MIAFVLLASILHSLAGAQPIAMTVGKVVVTNKCPFVSYLTIVVENGVQTPFNTSIRANGGSFSRAYEQTSSASSPVYRLSQSPASSGSNDRIFNLNYILDKNNSAVWYQTYGSQQPAFQGYTVAVTPSDPKCASLTYPPYADSPAERCEQSANLTVTLCAK